MNTNVERTQIFRDSQIAFLNAISTEILSTNQSLENFAGKYMYMHSDEKKDFFKNIINRRYISVNY